ncbi:energy-coupling factor transporter ATPase [Sporolactobacillus shoreicorticis]|uniref:Energy-coupling factor transporter ATP-binding protein EcfA2 n=1 Tax=Sporolactobacillus shoreicorticis TaxID=1923877 RepID=A0ABW5S302_9BACL|nr:energy-coupling factor transporter ATPase [Sporolactobacillus shoreicorticis]
MQIKLNHVTADYQLGSVRSPRVLQDVSLQIAPGTFTAVVGSTGAGKSSLLKVLNGLLLPKSGWAEIGDIKINSKTSRKSLKAVRKIVGMVFQFPESQLFAETVEQDISFGPLNFGASREAAHDLAIKMIRRVGLDESILQQSPFSLSGGQKRRVAIAGVLAQGPEVLALDEPTAGLDPSGKRELLSLLKQWNKSKRLTVILVTHDMETAARYADDAVVMDRGKVVYHGSVRSLFADSEKLNRWQLDVPEARRFQLKFEAVSGIRLPNVCLTEEELAAALIEVGRV